MAVANDGRPAILHAEVRISIPAGVPQTLLMHTCLSLSNIGGHCYVERTVSGLIAGLNAFCDSIEWCNIAIEGPSREGEARRWCVDLKLRLFDETVRATSRLPAGPDPAQSLEDALADIYASATTQITQIAEQHQGCCCHRVAPAKAYA